MGRGGTVFFLILSVVPLAGRWQVVYSFLYSGLCIYRTDTPCRRLSLQPSSLREPLAPAALDPKTVISDTTVMDVLMSIFCPVRLSKSTREAPHARETEEVKKDTTSKDARDARRCKELPPFISPLRPECPWLWEAQLPLRATVGTSIRPVLTMKSVLYCRVFFWHSGLRARNWDWRIRVDWRMCMIGRRIPFRERWSMNSRCHDLWSEILIVRDVWGLFTLW